MLRVPYYYALLLGLLTLVIVGFIQPISRYAYEGLEFELRSGALGATIDVGEFVKVAKNTTLRVEESRNHGQDLRGIFVNSAQPDGKTISVTAARGTRSEEHTSELQSLMRISYAVFCLKQKNNT